MRTKKAFTLIELLVVISVIALLLSILMPSLQKIKERAQFIICQSNLHSYGVIGVMYTADNSGKFPDPWKSIYSETWFDGEIQRYCRWHNADYDLEVYPEYAGPLWPYLQTKKVNMCPTFLRVSRTHATMHDLHVDSIPIVPQFSYSMNGFLGPENAEHASVRRFYVEKLSNVRQPYTVFFFGEENMWITPNINGSVLNDNALITKWDNSDDEPPFVDSFATFHKAKESDLNDGISNAVFVDGHVQSVELLDSQKLAWPLD